MKIKIAGIVNESIVDGPGFRTSIFVQGCPHHCPGCHNPQTHNFEDGVWMETGDIIKSVLENILLDGITLSGGEPFQQALACSDIASRVKNVNLSVWCYSGYTYEQLISGAPEWKKLLEHIDVLVDGPFILERKTLDARFRGSSNQRLIDVQKSLIEGRTVEFSI